METKFFLKDYSLDDKKYVLNEIELNKNNWFYVQVNASIRTTFLKYGVKFPKYVIFEELHGCTIIKVFRDDIENEKELLNWAQKYIFIKDELNIQAQANSDEEREFKFIIL